jgi:hypothetical protein
MGFLFFQGTRLSAQTNRFPCGRILAAPTRIVASLPAKEEGLPTSIGRSGSFTWLGLMLGSISALYKLKSLRAFVGRPTT